MEDEIPTLTSTDKLIIKDTCFGFNSCRHGVQINDKRYFLDGRVIRAILVRSGRTAHPQYSHFAPYAPL